MTLSRVFRMAAMMLVPILFSDSLAFAAKKPVDPAAMKARIQARGVGQGVRVTFADKTEAQGLIVSIDDRSFTLRPRKSDDVRQIEYTQIVGVHNDHLSRGQKVAIVAGVVAAGIAITAVVLVKDVNNSLKGPIL